MTSLLWLGLNDIEDESIWRWSDGSPTSFINFKDGQPNNFGDQNEDCVAMIPPSLTTTGLQWGDTICQKPIG